MNLVRAINDAKTQLNKIKTERDNQMRNLEFSFSTLSNYCNIYPQEEYIKVGKYNINDSIHIYLFDNNVYESKKDVNVIAGLSVIRAQIDAIYEKYEPDISSLNEGIKTLRTMNNVCEHCNGIGFIKKRTCAEDEGEMYPCPTCKGTGKSK